MGTNAIKNMGDLRSEILRLQVEVTQREATIQQEIDEISAQVKAPFEFLKSLSSWFKWGEKNQSSEDWATALLRIGLPFLINETFFKRSGLIMKALVGMLSQKVVQGINYDTITAWIRKISDWVKKQKIEKENTPDAEMS